MLFVIAAALFLLAIPVWRIAMDVAALLALVSDLSTSVDALIAKVGTTTPPVDLQPVADALTALKAKIDAAVTPPA